MSDQQYDNTNSGVLFPNTFKDSPKQPDLRGDIDIEGVSYKLAAWTRTSSKTEERFLSLKAELKDKPEPELNKSDPIGDLMEGQSESPSLPPSDDGGGGAPF